MGTPMALVSVTSLLASAVNYMVSPMLYNVNFQLAYPMWVSFGFCLFSLICGGFAAVLTIHGENMLIVDVLVLNYTIRNKKQDRKSVV